MSKNDTLLEQSNQIGYLERQLNNQRAALKMSREFNADLFDDNVRCRAEIDALRAENVRLRAECAEMHALLQGASANVSELRRELDALADHVGRTVQPPDWLPTRVADHAVVGFARRWLGRSTPNSARVAGRVIEAAHD